MPASEAMPAYWRNLATAQAGSRVAEGDERSELALDAADSREIRFDSRFRFARFSRFANTVRVPGSGGLPVRDPPARERRASGTDRAATHAARGTPTALRAAFLR